MVEVRNVTKTFGRKTRVTAVDDVSFVATPGSIYGLLGPNGAGKTTTLRCIATLLRPDSGTISVDGVDTAADARAVRSSIGFLTGDMRLSGNLTPREVIAYFAALNHVANGERDARLERLATDLEMSSFLDRPVEKLSSGQKQKTAIAVSLIHDPSVIIFDEPTSGLDVLASKVVVDFLRESARRGRTVILSTHIMSEAEQLCDTIGVILNGRLVASGSKGDVAAAAGASTLEDAFFSLVATHMEEADVS